LPWEKEAVGVVEASVLPAAADCEFAVGAMPAVFVVASFAEPFVVASDSSAAEWDARVVAFELQVAAVRSH